MLSNFMAKVFHFIFPKDTFWKFGKELVLFQYGKNTVEIIQVFRPRPVVYKNVTEEYEHESP